MKNILIASSLFMSLAIVANAQSFNVQAQCNFNQAQGRCVVSNNYGMPIYCSLHAQGQVANGAYVYANEDATIYPGTYAYVEVYSTYMPFVNVRGSANCQF